MEIYALDFRIHDLPSTTANGKERGELLSSVVEVDFSRPSSCSVALNATVLDFMNHGALLHQMLHKPLRSHRRLSALLQVSKTQFTVPLYGLFDFFRQGLMLRLWGNATLPDVSYAIFQLFTAILATGESEIIVLDVTITELNRYTLKHNNWMSDSNKFYRYRPNSLQFIVLCVTPAVNQFLTM